jgi:hypothetical protein
MLPKSCINLINILNNIICVVNLYLFGILVAPAPGRASGTGMNRMGYNTGKSGAGLSGLVSPHNVLKKNPGQAGISQYSCELFSLPQLFFSISMGHWSL